DIRRGSSEDRAHSPSCSRRSMEPRARFAGCSCISTPRLHRSHPTAGDPARRASELGGRPTNLHLCRSSRTRPLEAFHDLTIARPTKRETDRIPAWPARRALPELLQVDPGHQAAETVADQVDATPADVLPEVVAQGDRGPLHALARPVVEGQDPAKPALTKVPPAWRPGSASSLANRSTLLPLAGTSTSAANTRPAASPIRGVAPRAGTGTPRGIRAS